MMSEQKELQMVNHNGGIMVGMRLADIYKSISHDLSLVDEELKTLLKDYSFDSTREILEDLFKAPGKMLRPVLLLLSSRAVSGEEGVSATADVIKLAAAMELIHAASLVHDDI